MSHNADIKTLDTISKNTQGKSDFNLLDKLKNTN